MNDAWHEHAVQIGFDPHLKLKLSEGFGSFIKPQYWVPPCRVCTTFDYTYLESLIVKKHACDPTSLCAWGGYEHSMGTALDL